MTSVQLIGISQCQNPGGLLPQFTMLSGAIDGDFAYVSIAAVAPCTCPTGWTLLGTDYNNQTVFFRWVVGGDAGTAYTFGSTGPANGFIKVWRNVAQLGFAFFNESDLTAPSEPMNAGDVADFSWWAIPADDGATCEITTAGGTVGDGQYGGVQAQYDAITTGHLVMTSTGWSPAEAGSATYSSGSGDGEGATLVYLPVNVAPGAAQPLSPPNGAFSDFTQDLLLAWQAVPGQTGFGIMRTLGGTSVGWNGTEWGGDTPTFNPGSQNSLLFGPDGDADFGDNGSTYSWTVYVWTAGGESPESVAFTVTGEAAPTVDVTGPSGFGPSGTSLTATPTATWTYTVPDGLSMVSYRAVVYTDAQVAADGFVPGVSDSEWDSGTVAGTAESLVLGPLVDNGGTNVYVQISDGHQLSEWESLGWTQDAPSPPTPTLTVTPDSAAGAIAVAIANPMPEGDQVAALYNDVFRYQTSLGPAVAYRVATSVLPNTTWLDYGPGSGVDYTYSVVAISEELSSTQSAWQD